MLRRQLAADPALVARFRDESLIAAQLQHPGIVPVYAVGHLADGRPYCTMKLVRGETLSDVLKRRPSPAAGLMPMLAVYRRVCEALGYAHGKGIIHRDLKPANVMVGAFGEVLLLDWGLAKKLGGRAGDGPIPDAPSRPILLDPRAGDLATRSGLGSLPYMAPEQAAGRVDEVDTRSDVFGLGAILCVVLTGSPPYVGPTDGAVERKAIRGDLSEALERLDGCGADPELIALARQCLSPERATRPADAAAVAEAVAAYLAGVEARLRREELERAAAEIRVREERKRRRAQAVVAANVFLLFGLAGFGVWYQDRATRDHEAERRIDQSKQAAERAHAEGEVKVAILQQKFAERERDQVVRDRQARTRQAVEAALGRCEAALRADDPVLAAVALDEAEKRLPDGGADDLRPRATTCRAALDLHRELDRINDSWWSVPEWKFRDGEHPIRRCRAVFDRFGVTLGVTPPADAARLVNNSLIRERLLAALDLWHVIADEDDQPSLRAILLEADPYPFRVAVRQADEDDVRELVAGEEVFRQPGRFVTAVGQLQAIPLGRRVEIITAAARARPHDFMLLMDAGNLYERGSRRTAGERLSWYRAAVAIRPTSALAWDHLASALRDAGALREALACATEAVRADPTLAWVHHTYGNILYDLEDYPPAIQAYRKAIHLDPTAAGSKTYLGAALREVGQLEEAVAVLRAVIHTAPDWARPFNELGLTLQSCGDEVGAAWAFQEAVRLDPEYADAHANLGLSLIELDDLPGAIAACRKATRVDPNHARGQYHLGLALHTLYRNNPKKLPHDIAVLKSAIEAYREAVRLDPKPAKYHRDLADALNDVGWFEDAIVASREAVDRDPEDALAHYALGVARHETGDTRGAIEAFRRSLVLDPVSALAHHNLGRVLADVGDPQGASAAYRQSIILDPTDPVVHFNLGVVLSELQDTSGAIAAHRKALRIAQEDADADYYTTLAGLLNDDDQARDGLRVLRDGLAVRPEFIDTPGYRYLMARCACWLASGASADRVPGVERRALRQEALGSLRTELKGQQELARDTESREAVCETLDEWLDEGDLEGVREVEFLPQRERAEWARFWATVRQLRHDTGPLPVAPSPRPVNRP